MKRLLARIWLPLVGLIGWQLVVSIAHVHPMFFPAPAVLFRTAGRMVASGELLSNVVATLARTAGGFLIGAAMGLATGMLMGSRPWLMRSLDPMISALNATPKLVLLPLLLLLLGLGEPPRLALVALTVFILVTIHTSDAVRHVRYVWVEMAANYGADRAALFRYVYLPACLPQVFTGLRIALANALVIAISCELVIPSTGLGSLIWLSWQTLSTDRLYVAILVTAALGVVLHEVLRLAERWFVPWNQRTNVDERV